MKKILFLGVIWFFSLISSTPYDNAITVEKNIEEARKHKIMQYPYDSTARKFKKNYQKLKSLKRTLSNHRREMKKNQHNLESKKAEYERLLQKKNKKFANPGYIQELNALDKGLSIRLKQTQSQRRAKKLIRDHSSDKNSLLRKYKLLPISNNVEKAHRQVKSLQKHQQDLHKTYLNLKHQIKQKQTLCDELYKKVPQMPLSRYDILQCKQQAKQP